MQGDNIDDKAIVRQNMNLYLYKIFRLIIYASFNTYILGCLWFLISKEQNITNSWYIRFGLDKKKETWEKLVMSLYFALTILSTVGYGDFFPISETEMVIAVVVMGFGVAFFSFIMNEFINIMRNHEVKMGVPDKREPLKKWLISLQRFSNRQPL